jgi:raffinose/stachyose/melibiose transport system permease protein
VYYVICTILAVFALAPIVVLIFDALKTDTAVANSPFSFPTRPVWENFSQAWDLGAIGTAFANSAVYVVVSVVIVCCFAAAAAYALVRLRVRFGGSVMTYLLVASGVPIQSFLVPLFVLWTHLHLYNTRLGLIIVYVATSSPFAILLMRSYLLQIPSAFVEAARVDGANELRIARSIIGPMLWPGLTSVALVTAVAIYNDFIFAVTFLQSSSAAPVSLSFYTFQQANGLNYAMLSAGGVIVIAPIFVLFFVLQRRFVEGLSASGLRG